MRKKILLVAAAFVMTANVMAQTDITPARYVFANQEVGTYLYDEAMAGRFLLYRKLLDVRKSNPMTISLKIF